MVEQGVHDGSVGTEVAPHHCQQSNVHRDSLASSHQTLPAGSRDQPGDRGCRVKLGSNPLTVHTSKGTSVPQGAACTQ